jgi:hypothetical protein
MATGRSLTDVNFVLEAVNGSTSILLAVAIFFLAFYLLDQRKLHSLSWSEMIIGAPPGIALALPMLVIKIGLLLTRGSLWIWRQFAEGGAMPFWQRRHRNHRRRAHIHRAALAIAHHVARQVWRLAVGRKLDLGGDFRHRERHRAVPIMIQRRPDQPSKRMGQPLPEYVSERDDDSERIGWDRMRIMAYADRRSWQSEMRD